MEDEVVILNKSLHKLNMLFLHNEFLRNDKKLQQQIIDWAKELLAENREEWDKLHEISFEAIIKHGRTIDAKHRSAIKDKKYAPFREYFKKTQYKKLIRAQQRGDNFSANSFVEWFLANDPQKVKIPYVKQNQKNKLRQLAQQNSREFKKATAQN